MSDRRDVASRTLSTTRVSKTGFGYFEASEKDIIIKIYTPIKKYSLLTVSNKSSAAVTELPVGIYMRK